MKKIIFAVIGILILSFNPINAQETVGHEVEKNMKKTIYNYKTKDINGNEFNFSDLKGKKIMIVNTASKCGLTPQYKDLQELYEKYKDNNVVIVGFPSNDFGSQEPGNESEIALFCQKNYGVTFPMMSKVSVVGGQMDEIYQFLTQKSKNGFADSKVEWNFQKYLINEKGELVGIVDPKGLPNDPKIQKWLGK